jgi:hypothetical protein
MHSQISVEVFPSSRCCLPEHTLRNSGFNRFTAALLTGRLKFCFLHNTFYEIQRRRIPTFSDPTRLHGQVHGNIWKFMANRHRSRGNTCPAEYHAGMSDLKQIPDVSAQHTLSHSGTIFFLPWYQFVFCKPSFWSELALHLYEQSK